MDVFYLRNLFLQLWHCRHFQPSAELVSTILDALLLAKSPDSTELNLQNLAWLSKNTFSPFAAARASTTVPWPTHPISPKLFPPELHHLAHSRENHLWYHHLFQHNQKLYPCCLRSLHRYGTPLTTLCQNWFCWNHCSYPLQLWDHTQTS